MPLGILLSRGTNLGENTDRMKLHKKLLQRVIRRRTAAVEPPPTSSSDADDPSRRQWIAGAAGAAIGGTAVLADAALRPASALAQTTYVDTTSNQTVGGVKTFTSAPVVPESSFPLGAVSGLTAELAGKQPTIPPGTYAGVVATRADLSASTVLARTYVVEVLGVYRYDSSSSAPVDNWIVLAANGPGRFVFESDVLTLPIRGGGQDDWVNFGPANTACAAAGVTLRLGPGLYEAKSERRLASNLHLVLTPETQVRATIPPTGSPLQTPFCGQGIALPPTTTITSATSVGDVTVAISTNLNLAPGEFIEFFAASNSFRGAIYKVVAYDSLTQVVTLDRPLRMPSGSPLATTSFPAGGYVAKVEPVRDVLIECNGARIFGLCSRFIEFIVAWNCTVRGPVELGDGSEVTAAERLISFDAPSYSCEATQIHGDGGGRTDHGLSFESSEGSSFRQCRIRNCIAAGVIFQDAIDCSVQYCRIYRNQAPGAVVTGADANSGLGSDGCTIVGGSYSLNANHGIQLLSGSSRNVITGGALVLRNSTIGVLVGSRSEPCYDNVVEATVRASASLGVNLSSASVRTRVRATVSDCHIGIKVEAGAVGSVVSESSASSCNIGLSLSADTDCSEVTVTQAPGGTTEQVSIGSANVRMRGCRITMGPSGGLAANLYSGSLDIDHSTLALPANGVGIRAGGGSVVRVGSGVSIRGHGSGGIGLFAANGTFVVAGGADIQARAVGSGAGGRFNFGTATVGSEGRIEVSYPLLAATDTVVLTRTGGTGGYRITLLPASGFVIVGTSGDSFAWKVV